jgi:hypothetical protein
MLLVAAGFRATGYLDFRAALGFRSPCTSTGAGVRILLKVDEV